MSSDADLADIGSQTKAESDAIVEVFLSLGGDPDQLGVPQDLVAAIIERMLIKRGALDIAAAAAQAGVDVDLARRVWVSLGLDPEATNLSEQDVRTLQMFEFANGMIGERAAIELGRVLGQSSRRVAEAAVSSFRVGLELPSGENKATRSDLANIYRELIPNQVPAMMSAFDQTFRYHLMDVVHLGWAPDQSLSVATRAVAVGFADLVGFTEWALTASSEELVDALGEFESTIWEVASSAGIEIVKMIGDEVMFAAPSAQSAVLAAAELVAAYPGEGAVASIRVGISTGEAISRSGDLFGTVVNVAARLVEAAKPGTVLVTEQAAAETDRLTFGPPRDIKAKGFREPIRVRDLQPTRPA